MKVTRRGFIFGATSFALIAAGATWWSQHKVFHYLTGDTTEFVAQFAPPPPPDSRQARAELDELLALQRARTPAQVEAARADRKKDMARFYAALGLDSQHPSALPRLQALTDDAEADIGPYVRAVKDRFRRLRPYEIEPRLEPCIGDVQGDLSYPSGHATYGYVMAYLLADLVPERRAELERRADEFAQQRMVCGVHFRSDLEAGRRAARFLHFVLDASPRYRRDANAAMIELRAALGLPARAPRPL